MSLSPYVVSRGSVAFLLLSEDVSLFCSLFDSGLILTRDLLTDSGKMVATGAFVRLPSFSWDRALGIWLHVASAM